MKAIKVKGLDGYLGFLDGWVNDLAKCLLLNESVCSDMIMSLSEALNNAFVHGHKRDNTKEIVLSFYSSPSELAVVVTDEGDGYEYSMFREDLNEELLDVPGGRGLFIMRALTKEVRFNDVGNEVTLVFDRLV